MRLNSKIIQICASEQVEEAITRVYPGMAFQDRRPYLTLARYLRHNRLALAVCEGDDFGLVKADSRAQLCAVLPLGAILDKASRWSYCAQNAAKSGFERMCAEEDYEEITLLKEAWRKCRRPSREDDTALRTQQGEKPLRTAVRERVEAVDALYQGIDTDDLLASF